MQNQQNLPILRKVFPGGPSQGHRAALIGKASMDMLTVDLRGIPDPRVGDPVVLWGEGLPVEEVAQCAETIPYELLCSVRLRARFVEVGDS